MTATKMAGSDTPTNVINSDTLTSVTMLCNGTSAVRAAATVEVGLDRSNPVTVGRALPGRQCLIRVADEQAAHRRGTDTDNNFCQPIHTNIPSNHGK